MSGLEVVIIVGAGIYITKKVRERKEKKRLEKNAVSEVGAAHGRAEITQPPNQNSQNGRLRQQVPTQEEEALPTYRAPAGPPPPSNTTDMAWSNSIHLPTYDESSGSQPGKDLAVGDEKQRHDNGLRRVDGGQASVSTPLGSSLPSASAQSTHLAPPSSDRLPNESSEKKRKFWRRLSSSKAPAT